MRKPTRGTSLSKHLSSFAAPVLVIFVLPFLLLWSRYARRGTIPLSSSWILLIPGILVLALGLALTVLSMITFLRIGRGAIMPWFPTQRLIVAGPYLWVRNPMILGILIVLAGEALLFASLAIGVLALCFFVLNTVYFIVSEEKGLRKRFGDD